MGQKDKLVKKLRSNPKDFTFEECETLLGYFGYIRTDKGSTSGSRVAFINTSDNDRIYMHKPHPRKELLDYQIRQIIEKLEQEGLI